MHGSLQNDVAYGTLVSVIIPVLNSERFIGRTLRSVLDQTYQSIEVVVVDDGSTDETPAVVEAFAAQDTRVRFIKRIHGGVAEARNLAIREAKGPMIAPVDADDLWHPEKIALQVKALCEGGAKVGLVYCWSIAMDEGDLVIRPARSRDLPAGQVLLSMVEQNIVGNASAPLMRRSLVEQVGGYDPSLHRTGSQGAEDWKLYLSLAEISEYAVVPNYLVGYRITSNAMSNNLNPMGKSMQMVGEWIRQRHPEIPSRHWRRQAYCMMTYLCTKALLQDRFGVAATYQFRAYAAYPAALFNKSGLDFLAWFLVRMIGVRRPAWLRAERVSFEDFNAEILAGERAPRSRADSDQPESYPHALK